MCGSDRTFFSVSINFVIEGFIRLQMDTKTCCDFMFCSGNKKEKEKDEIEQITLLNKLCGKI